MDPENSTSQPSPGRRIVREAAYHVIAIGILMAWYLLAEAEVSLSRTLLLVGGYAVLGGGVLYSAIVSVSRDRRSPKASATIFLGLLLLAVFIGSRDVVADQARTSAIESAYAHRSALLDDNHELPLGRSAALDASLLGGTGDVKLLIAATAIRYDTGPLPTEDVASESAVLANANPRTETGDWLPEAKGSKWRRWVDSSLALDLRLQNAGGTSIDVSAIVPHLALLLKDHELNRPGLSELRCSGLVTKAGRYWAECPSMLEPGVSIDARALFDFEWPGEEARELMGRVSGLAVAMPETDYGFASDTGGWVPSDSGLVYYAVGGEYSGDHRYAASWRFAPAHPTWVPVATFNGVGGTGWFPRDDNARKDAYKVRWSRPFHLTSGRFKLRWTIVRYGSYTDRGPYIFIDVLAVKPISYVTGPRSGVFSLVETDYYHTASQVFDHNQASGRYVLRVEATNCRWAVKLWQERWR